MGPKAYKRKRCADPVDEATRQLHLGQVEVLVVADLKPGVDMAKAPGVDAAAAGWSQDIPLIPDFMKQTCVAYLATIRESAKYILLCCQLSGQYLPERRETWTPRGAGT